MLCQINGKKVSNPLLFLTNANISLYVRKGEEGERLLCDEPGTREVDVGIKEISFIFGSGKHGRARGRECGADGDEELPPWQSRKRVRGKLFPPQFM